MDAVASGHDSGCFLIEAIGHVTNVLICRHHLLHCGDSEALLTVDMLVRSLELDEDLLLSFQVLRGGHVEVDRE